MMKLLQHNNLIVELGNFSKKFPRIEKVLIVPDYNSGHQILENLSRSGSTWINFRSATITSLSIEIVEDFIISNGLELLPSAVARVVVDSVFNNLADSGRLTYFKKHPVNKGMVEALARTVSELRLSGITAGDLKDSCFINVDKASDIRLILAEYEKILKDSKQIDNAGLIALAWGQLSGRKSESKFLIPSNYHMRGLQRKFIEKLAGKDLIILSEDAVFGLFSPDDIWALERKPESLRLSTESERLKWLFDVKNSPKPLKDDSIGIFSAIGYRNEVREVLRKLCEVNIKIDDTEIIYTDSEAYADLIYSLCDKIGIQATFSEGMPFYATSAGRVLMGFLLWIKEDFGEIYLRRILAAAALKFEKEGSQEISGGSLLGYLLRTSGVGWGRGRYQLVLSKRIEECKRIILNTDDERNEGNENYLAQKIKDLSDLLEICVELLELVPETDKEGKIDFSQLCLGVIAFAEKHIKIFGETDAVFIKTAKERLSRLGKLIQSRINSEEAIEKLINLVLDIRLGSSGPKPGHLHVSHFKNGGKSGRANTFIVGLDESKFPERITQDPVLLDEERKNIADDLELSYERLSKHIYDMAGLISGLRGKVTFSYSTYDIKEDRRIFPSSLLLQVFRIKEGNDDADYNALFAALGQPVGFSGVSVELDDTDWWLNRLAANVNLKDGLNSVKDCFSGIKEGLIAQEKRESDAFTEYDGKVKVDSKEIDPRENKNLVMSCSRLESIAVCPFAYFIKYVLGVQKPDETEKDLTVWLDTKQKGSLLHEVFKIFLEQLNKVSKSPDLEKQKNLILSILDETIKRYREEIPPPSEVVFRNEVTQLMRDADVFIKINESLQTKAIKCEVSFGEKSDIKVNIQLGDGSEISLRGRIDRIDKTQGSEYHVWDYKTGSSYVYDERNYIVGGEQIQHGLYAEAAEKILKDSGEDKKAKVTKSGYLLPTEKGTKDGKGGIFVKNTALKVKWQEALRIMLDIIKNGTFMINDTESGCKFCDFIEICDKEHGQERIKRKLSNEMNKELELWKKLKEYE